VPTRSDLDRCLDLLDPLDVPWVNGGVMIRTARLRQAGVVWSTRYHWDDLVFHFACLVGGLRSCWMSYDDALPDAYYRKHGGEHYGQTLQTADGLRNCAGMIGWMMTRLQEVGEWSPSRRHALIRSFFHVCVLRPVDGGEYQLAGELLAAAAANGVLTRAERRRFQGYVAVRRALRASARATYYWNRLVRRVVLREYFASTPWTYGSVCPPSPAAEAALGELLAATTAAGSPA
jgi:hypothetical protein